MSSVKSVIISCAGIGSRLGAGTTKALMELNGRTLISYQLEMLKDVEDLRIVVGFCADDVINEVMKVRKDVIFVYNHEYFKNKTGASYYLGAKDGNEFAINIDGDLLVHPDDMSRLLKEDGEWIAYSDRTSDNAVFVQIDVHGNVTGFSREKGSFEWTGPCCLKKNKMSYSSGHVFNLLEPNLPMKGIKVRASDIDTYDDYLRALEFIKSW